MLLSNRGPLSFTLDGDGAGRPAWRRRARLGARAARRRAPTRSGSPRPCPTATAPPPSGASSTPRGCASASSPIDEGTYRAAYDVVCNATLWFAHHGLFDAARRPRLDRRWREAWDAYRTVNDAFADAAAESAPEGAAVLVQDYHLCLVAPSSASRPTRPAARPLQPHAVRDCPSGCAPCPTTPPSSCSTGMAAHHACTFHTQRWADAFAACCRDRGVDAAGDRRCRPWPPDADDLAGTTASAACAAAGADLDDADRRPAGRRCASTASSCRRTSCAASTPTTSCSRSTRSGASGSCSSPSSTRRERDCRSTSPTATRSRRSSRGSTTDGRRRPGRRSCTTPTTTSPVRSPPSSAPTSCS